LVMWPSGEARVCKTFHGGSSPSMTSLTFYSYDKQTETRLYFHTAFFCNFNESFLLWPG
jgi:hypothetical protein